MAENQRRVGSFDLVERVAVTPTGAVWRGWDDALRRAVALKHVAADAVSSRDRLRSEARVLAAITHPNIVSVIDLIERDDGLWLIEEWIDGVTLPIVIRSVGQLSPQQAVATVRGALLGLAGAHDSGIVHGDVSPSNMVLDRAGTTKLIDFGLAMPVGGTTAHGTPGFLSPEAAGGRPLVTASDVYSAAAVLAFLLRGKPVFSGPTAAAVIASQLSPRGPDLDGVTEPLLGVLRTALEHDPGRRPPQARAFLDELEAGAEQAFGAGWLRHAGLAAAVGVALGSAVGTAEAIGGAATVTGSPVPSTQSGPAVEHAVHAASTRRLSSMGPRSAMKVVLRSPLAVGGVVAAVAASVVAAVVLSTSSKPAARHTPLAGAPATGTATVSATTPTTVPATSATATALDLTTVDWKSISLPVPALTAAAAANHGSLCADHQQDFAHDYPGGSIPLAGGQAFVADPQIAPIPGVVDKPGWYLALFGVPQYGQLSGSGPPIAALDMLCTVSGGNAQTNVVLVFDGAGGKPNLIGIFRPTGPIKPGGISVAGGQINVGWGVFGPNDPHCCPSGSATGTIGYQGGGLVATPPITTLWTAAGAGPGGSPSAGGTPSAAALLPGAGQPLIFTFTDGTTYTGTRLATDQVADCLSLVTYQPLATFFTQHPCQTSVGRRLETVQLNGRTVAISLVVVTAPTPPGAQASHAYDLVGPMASAMRASGTGGIRDLLADGARPPGWPAAIPTDATYAQEGEDLTITGWRLWYLDGRNTPNDPTLTTLARNLFLSPFD